MPQAPGSRGPRDPLLMGGKTCPCDLLLQFPQDLSTYRSAAPSRVPDQFSRLEYVHCSLLRIPPKFSIYFRALRREVEISFLLDPRRVLPFLWLSWPVFPLLAGPRRCIGVFRRAPQAPTSLKILVVSPRPSPPAVVTCQRLPNAFRHSGRWIGYARKEVAAFRHLLTDHGYHLLSGR